MKKGAKLLICFILICSMFSFAGCGNKDKTAINNNDKVKNMKTEKEKDQMVNLKLYFDASKDDTNIKVAEEERVIMKEELLGEVIMQELINGPSVKSSSLKPILPKDTRLISFSIKDGVAYVNLSKNAKIKMSYGKEKVCLKGIVQSLTQLQSVSKVKIFVENKDVKTLGGNFDISKPIGKDLLKKIN